MSSLDRLIDLAKRTGDRLIVHDPVEGRDLVIMDIDSYEGLVIDNEEYGGHRDIRNLSSNQLLDQINRDIAVWRTNKEMEEKWDREDLLEDELFEEKFNEENSFGEDEEDFNPWHSAGSVIDRRFKDQKIERSEDQKFDDFEEDDENKKVEAPNFLSMPDFGEEEDSDEIKIDDIPDFDEFGEIKPKQVPHTKETQEYLNDGGGMKEQDLPDEDEPMFYEEPV